MSFRNNILATYSSQIVSVTCSFLSTILATRMLGVAGQGELAVYINTILISTLLISFGIPSAIVHFIASGKLEKQRLFSLILLILGIGLGGLLILILSFSSFAISHILLPEFIQQSSKWMLILFIHLVLIVSNSFLSAILQAEKKFRHAGLVAIIGSLTGLILYALKYYFHSFPIVSPLQWIILSLMTSNAIQFIVYLRQIYLTDRSYFLFSPIRLTVIMPLLQFAFLAFATNFIQFLSYRMDIWFVNYYHGKQMTGVYSLSVSLAQMVWLLPSAVQTVLYAFISTHNDKKLIIEKTIKSTRQIAIYAMTAGVIGYVLSIYLVPILFGEAFRESIQSIGILLLGVVPFCLSMAVSAYFAGTGRVKINLNSAILGFIVCLSADMMLIPTYGFLGAAFASVISYLTTVSYLLIKFKLE